MNSLQLSGIPYRYRPACCCVATSLQSSRLRDLAEIFLERGFVFTHETVRDWEAWFASQLIGDQLRSKQRGQAGRSWYVDETYGHACMEHGVIFTEPLTEMAIWQQRACPSKHLLVY